MTTALVLGGSGFVGRSLCDYLSGLGYVVINYDLQNSPQEDAAHGRLPEADVTFFLAWEVGGSKFLESRDAQLSQLTKNTALMLNVFPQLAGRKAVFVSSQLAVDDTVYGHTKRLGELWAREYDIPVLRLWNVYGGYEPNWLRSHVVADVVWKALNGHISLLTNGREERQFVYIDDVCRDIVCAVGSEYSIRDSTTGCWTSIRELVNCVCEFTGATASFSDREGSSQKQAIPSRLDREYTSLEEGLQNMIILYRSHK